MRDTDPEYVLAMENADTTKVWQLENLFELQAEEIAIQTCLLVQRYFQIINKIINENSFGQIINQTSFIVMIQVFQTLLLFDILSVTFRYVYEKVC